MLQFKNFIYFYSSANNVLDYLRKNEYNMKLVANGGILAPVIQKCSG